MSWESRPQTHRNWKHGGAELETPRSVTTRACWKNILTNFIPAMMAFQLFPFNRFTHFEINLLFAYRYKTIIEVGGHSGIAADGWTSFLQLTFVDCSFLSNYVYLTTADHDLHHSRPTSNFSKRFKVWDVLFGSFETQEGATKKRFDRNVEVRFRVLGLLKRPYSQQPTMEARELMEQGRRHSVFQPATGVNQQNEEAFASHLNRKKKTRLIRSARLFTRGNSAPAISSNSIMKQQ